MSNITERSKLFNNAGIQQHRTKLTVFSFASSDIGLLEALEQEEEQELEILESMIKTEPTSILGDLSGMLKMVTDMIDSTAYGFSNYNSGSLNLDFLFDFWLWMEG